MARIEGVFLPKEKRIEYGLTYIYGIGLETSKNILKVTKIDPNVRVKNLSSEQVAALQQEISRNCKVEGDLRKEVTLNIKRLQEIGSYRGMRHKKSLPVRGQRTKTNARTCKGPRGTSVAKKKAPTKK